MAHLGLKSLLAAATLLLASPTIAFINSSYSEIDMMQTQLALLDNRPKDCPPWSDTPFETLLILPAKDMQLQLPSSRSYMRSICRLQRVQRQMRLPRWVRRGRLSRTMYVTHRFWHVPKVLTLYLQYVARLPGAKTGRCAMATCVNVTTAGAGSTATSARKTRRAMP